MRGAYTVPDMETRMREAMDMGPRGDVGCDPGDFVDRLCQRTSAHDRILLLFMDNIEDLLIGPAYHVFTELLRAVRIFVLVLVLDLRPTEHNKFGPLEQVHSRVPGIKLLLTCRGETNIPSVFPDICIPGLLYKSPMEMDSSAFAKHVHIAALRLGLSALVGIKIANACANNFLLADLALDAVSRGSLDIEVTTINDLSRDLIDWYTLE